MQPWCLANDRVVDQSAFDRGNDIVDVFFLFHKTEAVGKCYGCDDIEGVPLGGVS